MTASQRLAPTAPVVYCIEQVFYLHSDTITSLGSSGDKMADILQFPIQRKNSYVITQLDASIACVHGLETASRLSADEVRLETLGARLDIASLQDAMCDLLPDPGGAPRLSSGLQDAWRSTQDLLDQVTTCAVIVYEEASQAETNYTMREQLRTRCRSALMELRGLRSLLSA